MAPSSKAQYLRRYLLLCGVLVAFYSVMFFLYVPYKLSDSWEHAAAIRTLAEKPFFPGRTSLMAGPFTQDREYSPYLLGLALVAKISGLSPHQALKVGAVLVLLILFIGLYRFSLNYAGDGAAATPILISFLFLWTTRGAMIREHGSLPSFFASCAAFILWDQVIRFLRRGRLLNLVSAVCIITLIWISHQIQGGLVLCSAMLIAMSESGTPVNRRRLVLYGLPLLTVTLGELWPYFSSIWLLVGNTPDTGLNYPLGSMGGNLKYFGFILGPSLPAIFLLICTRPENSLERFLRCGTSVLLALFIPFTLAGVNYASYLVWNMGNMAALWIGWLISTSSLRDDRLLSWLPLKRAALVKSCKVVLALSVLLQLKYSAGWVRWFYATPEGTAYHRVVESIYGLKNIIGPHDTVVSDLDTAFLLPSIAGHAVTRPSGHELDYNHNFPEILGRAAEVKAFFRPGNPDQSRKAYLRKYGVRFILVNKSWTDTFDHPGLLRMGRARLDTKEFLLVEVVPL